MPVDSGVDEYGPRGWPEGGQQVNGEDDGKENHELHIRDPRTSFELERRSQFHLFGSKRSSLWEILPWEGT